MGKNTFFTGQPVFSQLINFIPRGTVAKCALRHNSDRYTKKFDTYSHLISMLFVSYKHCTSLREVEFGMSVCHQKLGHLGLTYVPARSTLSEANARRSAEVFESIYQSLYSQLKGFLPDSRSKKLDNRLYIIDSTTVSLFQEIMGTIGRKRMDGKRKGGFKVHSLVKADEDVPKFIVISGAASHDSTFLKHVKLPEGSILTFDKGYVNYQQYHRFTKDKISIVTRLRENAVWSPIKSKEVKQNYFVKGVLSDDLVMLGHQSHKDIQRVKGRVIKYKDEVSGKIFTFFTNDLKMSPLRIALVYQKRWQIEVLFKRIKQNYPLQYFLGDNENAIKIQTWCVLIADLLVKVLKSGIKHKWSFSGVVAIIRHHLLEYINLREYLESPESILIRYRKHCSTTDPPNLFTANKMQWGLGV